MKSFNKARADFEKNYVVKLLNFTNGNVSAAARISGKDRKDFYTLMNRRNIKPNKFRKKNKKII